MPTMQSKIVLASAAAVAILAASALVQAQMLGPVPTPRSLPPPYATPSADNHPVIVAKPADGELHAPPGFHVQMWAEGFARPRFMLQGTKGEILLSDSGKGGAPAVDSPDARETDGMVYVFPAANPVKREILIRGLNRPYGLALWHNYLYVAEADSIKRYPYDPQRLTAGKGQEIISLEGFNEDHWTRSLLFDRQNQKLYVGIGSAANVETGEDPRRAAINRYNPDGSGRELFATGTRNPIGLHWYPDSDVLWAAVQERDDLGANLVPDYFTHIDQAAFYGWPYSYIGQHLDPRIKNQRPDLTGKAKIPDLLLPAHVAVLDFLFYTGQMFPPEYHMGAFLAFHGSWNRSQRVGYEVAFIPFSGGKPSGPPRDFVTGWILSPSQKQVWGRPVAMLQMADGSILLSDDGGGKIWRITDSPAAHS
jgi:glucose/arabinose dehydrogenase